MRRRAILGVIAIIALVIVTTGSALALLVRHVPAFYERAALPPGETRDALSRDLSARSMDLASNFGGDQPWEQQFTQEQFNGYFQGQNDNPDLSAPLVAIPEDVRDVRVAFDDDQIRVGFRYGDDPWSCVVSVEFRVWLVANKTNLIALELCDFRAGALPLGTRTLIDFITEAARHDSIDVTWFRHAGHPIALLQLQANKSRPTFQLRRLEVSPGKFIVASSPTQEPAGPAAAPTTPASPPEPPVALPSR
jgi:hypothetical protein